MKASFKNLPKIDVFVPRWTQKYIGKVVRLPKESVHCQRKNRGHHDFVETLQAVLPELSNKDLFKKWIHFAEEAKRNGMVQSKTLQRRHQQRCRK